MNDEAKIEFKKTVMNNKEEDQKEDLETTEENIEEAAKQVAHTTKSERDKEVRRTPEKSQNWRRGGSKVYKSNREKGIQDTSKERQGRSSCDVQHDARRRESDKKTFDGVVCQWQIHGRQRRMVSGITTTLRGSTYGS